MTEQSGLLSKPPSRRPSRRTSYGTQAQSEPLRDPRGGRRLSAGGKAGNSRSRSKARSPPRQASQVQEGTSVESTGEIHPAAGDGDVDDPTLSRRSSKSSRISSRRGRDLEERPLSALTSIRPNNRRMSYAEDSSGDEGGDLARGLAASGGGAMMGTGMAAHGSAAHGPGMGMDLDPAEELTCEDLEVPLDDSGKEVRLWADALRVSWHARHRLKIRPRFLSSSGLLCQYSSLSWQSGVSSSLRSSRSGILEPPSWQLHREWADCAPLTEG